MLALVVFEHDGAQHAVTANDGNNDAGKTLVGAFYRVDAQGFGIGTGVHHQHFAIHKHAVIRQVRRDVDWLVLVTHAVLVNVVRMRQTFFGVPPPDADVAGIEHFTQLVANQIDDGAQVQLPGHALLNAVYHRQLGFALLGLLQQPLRFVEQASVLERGAHRRADGGEHAQVGLAVGMLALVVLDDDEAQHALGAVDRRGEQRVGPVGARYGTTDACRELLLVRTQVAADALAQQPHLARVLGPHLARRPLRQVLTVLDVVENLHGVGFGVPPADAQVLALEQHAQLVAHQIHDVLEAELGGHALLNAVDQRQLGGALLECGCLLGDLGLEILDPVRMSRRHGGLGCEHCQSIAVAVGEAAESALDVGVEVAEHLLPRHQRSDHATALLGFVGPRGAVTKMDCAGAACRVEPGGDGLQQRCGTFALGQPGAGDLERTFRRLEHQQHAPGARRTDKVFNQRTLQPVGAARRALRHR